MWTTCFVLSVRGGAIESTIQTGPSIDRSSSIPISSANSRCSASIRLSPVSTPPPGSSQYSLPGFSWRQRRICPFQSSTADTRTRGAPITARPSRGRRAEAALAPFRLGQLVDDAQLDLRHREHDELRDSDARLHGERAPAVGVEKDDAQLAAVAGVDETRRVDERDAVFDREPAAWLHVAGVAARNRHRE